MNLLSTAAEPSIPTGFNGITSEPLLFILFALVILFGAQSLWGTVQKIVEKYKSRHESTMEEKKLDFEIDKFSIETIQKAVITLNEDQKTLRKELSETKIEVAQERQARLASEAKNAAYYRYIAKAVSKRRLEGIPPVPVDTADHFIIPEVVNITQ